MTKTIQWGKDSMTNTVKATNVKKNMHLKWVDKAYGVISDGIVAQVFPAEFGNVKVWFSGGSYWMTFNGGDEFVVLGFEIEEPVGCGSVIRDEDDVLWAKDSTGCWVSLDGEEVARMWETHWFVPVEVVFDADTK